MSWRAELPSEGLEKILWEQPWDVQRKQNQIPVLAGITPCSSTGSGRQARRQLLGRLGKPGGLKHWSKSKKNSPSCLGDQGMWCVERGPRNSGQTLPLPAIAATWWEGKRRVTKLFAHCRKEATNSISES